MKRLLAILFLCSTPLVASAGEEPLVLIRTQVVQGCNQGACQLGDKYGNGVVIANDGQRLVIATAGHALEGQSSYIWCNEAWHPAVNPRYVNNRIDDFGVVEIRGNFPDVPAIAVHPGPLKGEVAMVLDTFWPGDPHWKYRQLNGRGWLQDSRWRFSSRVVGGVSGSPLLADGMLAGIVVAVPADSYEEITFFTPLDRIHYHLTRWGYSAVLERKEAPKAEPAGPTTEDLLQRLEELLADENKPTPSEAPEEAPAEETDEPEDEPSQPSSPPPSPAPHVRIVPPAAAGEGGLFPSLMSLATQQGTAWLLSLGLGPIGGAVALGLLQRLRKRRAGKKQAAGRHYAPPNSPPTQEEMKAQLAGSSSGRVGPTPLQGCGCSVTAAVGQVAEDVRDIPRPEEELANPPVEVANSASHHTKVEILNYFNAADLQDLQRFGPPQPVQPESPSGTGNSQPAPPSSGAISAGDIQFPTQNVDYSKIWTDHMFAAGINPVNKAIELGLYVEAFDAAEKGVLILPGVSNQPQLIQAMKNWINREFRKLHESPLNIQNVHHKAFFAFLHERVVKQLREGTYLEFPQHSQAADAIEQWVDARLVERQIFQGA